MSDFKANLKDAALDITGRMFPNMYRARGGVLFPMGHAVADRAPLHVKHLLSVPSQDRFEADLEFLCRNLRPLELSQLGELVPNELKNSWPRSFLLSFDDGLQEAHKVIAPMLFRKGIPAIFFINSATVGNKRLMWRHKISLLIERARQQPERIPPQIKLSHHETLESKLRALRFADEGLVDEIARFLEVDFDEYLRVFKPYLTIDQVLELSRLGFPIGAHSHCHPYFQDLSIESQEDQVFRCVQFIRELGLPCRYFAFPFHDNGVSIGLFKYLKSLGVALSFGTSEARVDSIDFSFQRFAIDVPGPGIPEILRRLSGKSMLRRLSRTETIRRNA